ncbi:MAG: bifunctional nuclease family protein [Bacteroidia bacterium]|nr:bifunctional nuclease family protein [Bacteroidia bacterium]
MEKKILMKIIGISAAHGNQTSNNYLLLLEEMNGNRRLPVVIGVFEAQSIAIALEKVKIQRPISHDLFKNFADAFHISVKEVLIYNLVEGVFYSKLVCTDLSGDIEHEIDARTSDAIAIAVRFDAPIYVYEFILKEAGYTVDENDNVVPIQSHNEQEQESETVSKSAEDVADALRKYSLEELQQQLQKAISEEKYELAAKIHQEIERRKS